MFRRRHMHSSQCCHYVDKNSFLWTFWYRGHCVSKPFWMVFMSSAFRKSVWCVSSVCPGVTLDSYTLVVVAFYYQSYCSWHVFVFLKHSSIHVSLDFCSSLTATALQPLHDPNSHRLQGSVCNWSTDLGQVDDLIGTSLRLVPDKLVTGHCRVWDW